MGSVRYAPLARLPPQPRGRINPSIWVAPFRKRANIFHITNVKVSPTNEPTQLQTQSRVKTQSSCHLNCHCFLIDNPQTQLNQVGTYSFVLNCTFFLPDSTSPFRSRTRLISLASLLLPARIRRPRHTREPVTITSISHTHFSDALITATPQALRTEYTTASPPTLIASSSQSSTALLVCTSKLCCASLSLHLPKFSSLGSNVEHQHCRHLTAAHLLLWSYS